jgi:signal transduction histidine kinase
MFNSRLVEVEDRVSWIDARVDSLAKTQEHSLKSANGCRLGRTKPTDPDPMITLDLGSEKPLSQIYIIPAQREPAEEDGLFPRRFSILASKTPGFEAATTIYTTSQSSYPNPDIAPLRFSARGIDARYLRVVVHAGRDRGITDLCALSEVLVFSGNVPVSFGAKVEVTGSLTVPGLWAAEYLTDGRSPLGIWQSGRWSPNRGDLIEVSDVAAPVEWSINLDSAQPIDRLVIFPYELSEFSEAAVLSGDMSIWISDQADGQNALEIKGPGKWSEDGSCKVPVILPLHGMMARNIRIVSHKPWQLGDRNLHGMAELEVWSGSTNLASNKPVTRVYQNQPTTVMTLTDGFASVQQVTGVDVWLSQLNERWRLERELATLLPVRTQMASESELNATWGAAVALGLTFLIPVVIVERRRLISKNQLDILRKRIASDLHDDIGSNLGSISLIARTARKDLVRLNGPEEVLDDLGEMESIARESSLAMRDIVWLLERRQDSIGDLVQRMRETASRLLREVDYSIECDSVKIENKLTLDAKRHLFLFYKEAVHNIVKHSRARHVVIRLGDQGERLFLEVSDDGIGLPQNGTARGNSVQKLEERARVLEGQLQIESKTGVGTLLRLVVRRTHLIAKPHHS